MLAIGGITKGPASQLSFRHCYDCKVSRASRSSELLGDSVSYREYFKTFFFSAEINQNELLLLAAMSPDPS